MSCSRDIGVQKQSKIDGFFSDTAYLPNKSWLNLPKLSETFSEPPQTSKMELFARYSILDV